jgi:hypothetical protein
VNSNERSGDTRFKMDANMIAEFSTVAEIKGLEAQCEQFVLQHAPKGLCLPKSTENVAQWVETWKRDMLVSEIGFDASGRICKIGVIVTGLDGESQWFVSFNHKGAWGVCRQVEKRTLRKCETTENALYLREWKLTMRTEDGRLDIDKVCRKNDNRFTMLCM